MTPLEFSPGDLLLFLQTWSPLDHKLDTKQYHVYIVIKVERGLVFLLYNLKFEISYSLNFLLQACTESSVILISLARDEHARMQGVTVHHTLRE